eukprot:4560946-Pleurochrysis_carterae.AAC.1
MSAAMHSVAQHVTKSLGIVFHTANRQCHNLELALDVGSVAEERSEHDPRMHEALARTYGCEVNMKRWAPRVML